VSFLNTDIAACLRAVRSRETSAVELVSTALSAIDETDAEIQAFTARNDVAVQSAASEVDRRLREGESVGPLAGLPVAIKDLYDCAGWPTSYGSRAFPEYVPDTDATAVARLRAAGAIVVGKTRTAEFAWSTTTPPTKNPAAPERIPGGSSGGSAAAVAAGMVPAALGTDTGGSIRIPAAVCGIAGIKPTYGAVGRGGLLPANWSLDTAGPLAGRIDDLRIVLAELVGHDRRDLASAADGVLLALAQRLRESREVEIDGLRLGVVDEPLFEITDAGAQRAHNDAIESLASAGAVPVPVRMPECDYVEGALLAIDLPEGAAIHTQLLRERGDDVSAEIRALLEFSHLIPGTLVGRGQRARTLIRDCTRRLFREYQLDALLVPAAPGPGTRLDSMGTLQARADGATEPALWGFARICWLANLTGQPSVALPLPGSRPPLGLQLIGRPFRDDALLAMAGAIERLLAEQQISQRGAS
jgi:aspartyl-tRNA(Asn)/glutamyl-tRNA(Gln) amidotransferase subunit A